MPIPLQIHNYKKLSVKFSKEMLIFPAAFYILDFTESKQLTRKQRAITEVQL
ncbi:hypothetical protein [Anabaena azotica]|uniref:hypothetical protein n=1 Tax=Anabaena azotica TaxID=197653 RepID=UPI0039A5F9CF